MAAASSFGYAPRRSFSGLAIVVGLHLLLLWALVSGLAQRVVDIVKQPIQTKLIEELKPEPPPPPAALPPPPTTPPPSTTPLPVPIVVPTLVPPPVVAAPPAPAPPPPITPPPPPSVEATRSEAPAVHVPTPAAPARNPDDVYVAELRGYLNGIKRYPTSREARQVRPQGTVRLWLDIDRAGQLIGAGVETSSGVLLLDNEALRTVRNGRFTAFPNEAFSGQPSHRFVIAIEYIPPSG